MDRNRLDPVALHALRSLAPSDPLAPLVARAMRARVPHQRDLNLAPRPDAYLDALSEAAPRDLSYRDALNLRNAPALQDDEIRAMKDNDAAGPYVGDEESGTGDYAFMRDTPMQNRLYRGGR